MKDLLKRLKDNNIFSVILCVTVFLAAFLICTFFIRIERDKYEILALVFSFAILFILCFALLLFSLKVKKIAAICAGALFLLSVILFSTSPFIAKTVTDTAYDAPAVERSVFQDKSVLIFVPHQDDEINVAAGVIEQYVKGGSTVRIVFETAGDQFDISAQRNQEALKVAEFYGVPKENLIFLGFGDNWNTEYGHIYNAPKAEVITSANGKTHTYEAGGVAPYKDEAYTRENLYNDFEEIILKYLPDTLICVDYDSHPDHRATSLLFEEAMGNVLKIKTDYHPTVYKSFAYTLSWYAKDDFYADNIRSTVQFTDRPSEDKHMEEIFCYVWGDRVRMPVDTATLSYTVFGSSTYKALSLYASQNATDFATEVINGDKVFFERETESVLYESEISVSSNPESAYKLTDFKLGESSNINTKDTQSFLEGAWYPSNTDADKEINVNFSLPLSIDRINLYDNMSTEVNILNAKITFSDGSEIETGALDTYGAKTEIKFDVKKNITSFTVKILESEGEGAGFTEIEAFEYSQSEKNSDGFIKVKDENGDFAYEYITDGVSYFDLYAYKTSSDLSDYTVTASGDIAAEIVDGRIKVTCKNGKEGSFKVVSATDGCVYDEVNVKNLNAVSGAKRFIMQRLCCDWNFERYFEFYGELFEYLFGKLF